MQNKYPIWKNASLLLMVLLGLIYALPNLYIDEPAVQISAVTPQQSLSEQERLLLVESLKRQNIAVRSQQWDEKFWTLRFFEPDAQLKARDWLAKKLGSGHVLALALLPTTPAWLRRLGAEPMKLGLDLRGGVHFLLDVDVQGVIQRRNVALYKEVAQTLRQEALRYQRLEKDLEHHRVSVHFANEKLQQQALTLLRKKIPDVTIEAESNDSGWVVQAGFSDLVLSDVRQRVVEQTMSTLRNRVDELGVAEAAVRQQGQQRISVDLPGIQDAVRAKEILGGTATLEFRMVADSEQSYRAERYEYHQRPVWLNRQVILSGDAITYAASLIDDQTAKPSVIIQLGGGGEHLFHKTTRQSVGQSMAIVYVESKMVRQQQGDQVVKKRQKIERVISVATIQSALGNRFHITGLDDMEEARNLALLLRAGALPTAIDPVEEKTVGPTLGAENIEKGLISLSVGLCLIMIFMVIYYRLMGLIANIALLLNLVLLVALLSLIGTTLTLPGIASMVLTLGMAVDANVLIYERIREELRRGSSVQAAIYSGYDRAFATIVDANLTTLIVGLVLFAIGSGSIQAFAVVLIIGLLTSMITGVACSRAMVNFIYGGRAVKKISIGI